LSLEYFEKIKIGCCTTSPCRLCTGEYTRTVNSLKKLTRSVRPENLQVGVSDCCLTPTQQIFSYALASTSIILLNTFQSIKMFLIYISTILMFRKVYCIAIDKNKTLNFIRIHPFDSHLSVICNYKR